MLISVVMAVYNGEKYIQSAIDSILNQTYKDFEFIIVNDGSLDQTRDILNSISDSRAKIIHLEKNRGAANALNTGIGMAKGDWIAVHDADDLSEPTRLQEQVKYIKSHPECIGTGSFIKGMPGNTYVPEELFKGEENGYNHLLNEKEVYDTRLFTCYLCHGSSVYSKSTFQKMGGYNPKFKICYDYDLWLRMFDVQIIQKIPKVLYHYRISYDSLGKVSSHQTCYELQTIASNYIYHSVKNSMNKEPVFVVLGSKEGCQLFKRTIQKEQNLQVKQYLFYNGTFEAFNQIKRGKVDAILLLNDIHTNQIMNSLLRMGLNLNENVFLIWNYKF
jgi:glycosyltransferase involved in cell wall biosynthesis